MGSEGNILLGLAAVFEHHFVRGLQLRQELFQALDDSIEFNNLVQRLPRLFLFLFAAVLEVTHPVPQSLILFLKSVSLVSQLIHQTGKSVNLLGLPSVLDLFVDWAEL